MSDSGFLEDDEVDLSGHELANTIERVCAAQGLQLKSFAVLVVAQAADGDRIGCIDSGCSCPDCTRNMIETFCEARGAKVTRIEEDSAKETSCALH